MVAYDKAEPLNGLGQHDPFAVQTQGGCLSEPSQPLYATSDTAVARDPPHPECKYLMSSAAGWVGCSLPFEDGQHPCDGPANPGEGRRVQNQPVPLLCAGWGRTQRESTSPGEVGLESFKPCQQLLDAAPVIKAWAFLPCGAPGKAGF